MAKKIKITETALRDAHQSLIATRMTTEEMLPILDSLDKIGYYSLECWGGATYDACLRFLNEDPWQRLRTIKDHCPNTKLQMLFRGQNMLGYRHYADDCVEYLVERSIANGIDIIRIFDALNDIKNLKTAIDAANREGGHAQVAISYTTGPVFTDDYYVEYAKRIADAGAHSICIKDMAALLTPSRTESLVRAIKEALPEMPLQLHTHYTSGLASMCLLKAVEAGADAIDTAISPLALGTSHAPTESMVAALQGTPYDTGLDIRQLAEIRAYFMTLREKYIESGLLDPKMLATDAKALIYQVPGGMLSNLLSQLKQAGKEDKLTEVLEGTQAVFNVITGERYSMCTQEFKGMVAGEYGTTPMPIDPAFQKKICGDMEIITGRPADRLLPELDRMRHEIEEWMEQPEDVLSYAQFPKVAMDFFEKRRNKKAGINGKLLDKKNMIHPV